MGGLARNCLATAAVAGALYACNSSAEDAPPEPALLDDAAAREPAESSPIDPPDTDAGEEYFPPPDLSCPPAEPELDAGSFDGGTLLNATGGSRLKAVHVTTTDGLDVFVGVRDTLANRQCKVGIAPRGSYADYARSPSKCALPDEGERFYLDAACTQSVFGNRFGSAPENAEVIVSDAKGLAKVKTGAALGGIDAYEKSATGCWPTQVAAVSIVSEEPITEVAFTEKRVALSKRLEAIVWSGSDGSSIFAGDVHDNFFDAPVLVARGRWEPFRAFVGSPRYFPHPNWGSSSCPSGFDLFETSDAPAPGTVLVWDDLIVRSRVASACSCAGVNPKVTATFSCAPPARALEYLGAAPSCFYLPAAFGASNGTRLTVNRPSLAALSISKPVPLPSGIVLDDSTLGVTCHAEVASDGVLRCLPNPSTRIAFSDAACTVPVVEQQGTAVGSYARRHRESLDANDTCDSTVYAPGAALGMGDVYRLVGGGGCDGACVKFTPSERFAAVVVDPSTFMPLTLEER